MNETVLPGFKDRREAGRRLASLLQATVDEKAIILALPRGGVPVAAEISKVLRKPLDVLVVRKLGVPGHEEFAMGAIAGGGVRVVDEQLISQLGLSRAEVDSVIRREARELERREHLYRGTRDRPEVAGGTVIVVDDGVATGSTMSAAIQLLRRQKAERIVVAVPVAPRDTVERLREEADEVVVALEPEPFGAVGRWYEDFSQTTDEEVQTLLRGDWL